MEEEFAMLVEYLQTSSSIDREGFDFDFVQPENKHVDYSDFLIHVILTIQGICKRFIKGVQFHDGYMDGFCVYEFGYDGTYSRMYFYPPDDTENAKKNKELTELLKANKHHFDNYMQKLTSSFKNIKLRASKFDKSDTYGTSSDEYNYAFKLQIIE